MNRDKQHGIVIVAGIILAIAPWIHLIARLTTRDIGRLLKIVFSQPDWIITVALVFGLLFVAHKVISTAFNIREMILVGCIGVITTIGCLADFTYGTTDIDDVEQYVSLVKYVKWEEWHEDDYEVCVSEDDDGNCTQYETRCRSVSDSYFIVTTTGSRIGITKSQFEAIGRHFGTTRKKEWHNYMNWMCDDGNWFWYYWGGTDETALSVSQDHGYVNLIKGSNSILKTYSELKGYTDDLPDDPRTKQASTSGYLGDLGPIYLDRVLDEEGILPDKLEHRLDYITGVYNGRHATKIESQEEPAREEHISQFYVVTKHDDDYYYALHHKLCGGNKNELFVLCGLDDDLTVKWWRIMTWSPNEEFKVRLRQRLESEVTDFTDVEKIQNIVVNQINQPGEQGWERMQMADKDYLMSEIEVPMWVLFVTPVLVLLLLSVLVFFFVAYVDL